MAATIVESVALNFTDLTGDKTGCTTLGSNKFWKGFVEDLGNGQANFECRWGPTGTPGSDKGSVRGTSLSAAKEQLRKKVKEKEAKGYTRLDTRSDQEEITKAVAKGVTIASAPAAIAAPAAVATSTFHPEVGRLLGTIYNETAKVVRAGLSAQAGATADNPIGNLSDRQLDLGGAILDEIAEELKRTFGPESSDNRNTALPLAGGIPRTVELTNRFMSNIPREISRDMRGRENLHRLVLSSYERLDAQRTFLQLLRDAHLTKDVFQAAGHTTSTGGKEKIWYDGLGCEVDFCERGSADFRRVEEIFNTNQSKNNSNWWRNGRPVVRVAKVYKFCRNGTSQRFDTYAAKVVNKPNAVGTIVAWHGTRVANILGIGKSGLLMPENLPRGVATSGKAFGRGIYHAPNWAATKHTKVGSYPTQTDNGGQFKSLNYTDLSGANYGSGNTARSAYLFLQDVALGCADVRTSACWDKHRPDNWPTNDFIYACGSKNQGGFVNDELVTFDQDAQVFKYLLEIELV